MQEERVSQAAKYFMYFPGNYRWSAAFVNMLGRGAYGGAIGFFGYNGNVETAITIRTAIVRDGVAHVQAGGGIVADSDPAAEYQESVSKAQALVTSIRLAGDLTQRAAVRSA